jgi:hypothetical protein
VPLTLTVGVGVSAAIPQGQAGVLGQGGRRGIHHALQTGGHKGGWWEVKGVGVGNSKGDRVGCAGPGSSLSLGV